MNEVNDTLISEYEADDDALIIEANDENPAVFFRISAPPHLYDTWSLN